MKLEDKISKFKTVERENCARCGNPWWFDLPDKYECTTCCARFGKLNCTKQGYLDTDALRIKGSEK